LSARGWWIATRGRRDAAPSAIATIIEPVPRISAFYGIVIEMYFGDHPPPHFHARYGGDTAKIEIATGVVIAGSLPGRALRLVREWMEGHRDELEANWERAVRLERLAPIEPLR
jgi:hypothetical protein